MAADGQQLQQDLSSTLAARVMEAIDEDNGLASKLVEGVVQPDNLRSVLHYALRHFKSPKTHALAVQVVTKLNRLGQNAFWTSLAILQEKPVQARWSKHKDLYAQIYAALLDNVCNKSTDTLLAGEAEGCVKVLRSLIKQGKNDEAIRLLGLKHVQQLVNFDQLLSYALTALNAEMAVFLVGDKTNKIPSSIRQLQLNKSKWSPSDYELLYAQLVNTLVARSYEPPLAAESGGASGGSASSTTNAPLVLEEVEQGTLLCVYQCMVQRGDNAHFRSLIGRKPLANTINLLDISEYCETVGFSNLLVEALDAGNGEAACMMAPVLSGESLLEGVLTITSYRTSYFWQSGSYASTYNTLIQALLSDSLQLRRQDDVKTRRFLHEVLVGMTKRAENAEVKALLKRPAISPRVSRDDLLVDSIHMCNFAIAEELATQDRTNLPAAFVAMNAVSGVWRRWYGEAYYDFYSKSLYVAFVTRYDSQNGRQLSASEKKDFIEALEDFLQETSHVMWENFVRRPELLAQVDLERLLLFAMRRTNGRAVHQLRIANQQDGPLVLSAQAIIRAIAIVQSQSASQWEHNNVDYHHYRIYNGLRDQLFQALEREGASLTLSPDAVEDLHQVVINRLNEMASDDYRDNKKQELIRLLKNPRIFCFLEDAIEEIVEHIVAVKKLGIIRALAEAYQSVNPRTSEIVGFFGVLQSVFLKAIRQNNDLVFTNFLAWFPEALGLSAKGRNSPLGLAVQLGRSGMVKGMLDVNTREGQDPIAFDYDEATVCAVEIRNHNAQHWSIPMSFSRGRPEIDESTFQRLVSLSEIRVTRNPQANTQAVPMPTGPL